MRDGTRAARETQSLVPHALPSASMTQDARAHTPDAFPAGLFFGCTPKKAENGRKCACRIQQESPHPGEPSPAALPLAFVLTVSTFDRDHSPIRVRLQPDTRLDSDESGCVFNNGC